jgi:hypothetical protein
MNGGAFMFMVMAILAVGLLAFSYTKPGKKMFHLEYDEED